MPGVSYWNDVARKALVGKRIVDAKYLDFDGEGNLGVAFVLDDGTTVIVSQDDEGNGPGSLFLEGRRHGPESGCLPVIRKSYREE